MEALLGRGLMCNKRGNAKVMLSSFQQNKRAVYCINKRPQTAAHCHTSSLKPPLLIDGRTDGLQHCTWIIISARVCEGSEGQHGFAS